MKENTKRTLAALAGTDLARLAIPKPADIDKIMLSSGLISQVQLMSQQMRKAIEPHQALLSGLTPTLTEFAKAIEKQYRPQVIAFQTIAEKLQPLISHQTKIAHALSIAMQANPTFEAIKTLSSYNAFQKYRETFEEFGGGIDPDNVTEEEIEQAIKENREVIEKVNEIVIQADAEGTPAGDIPALIYTFLLKIYPGLNKGTYGIIVLIITTAFISYGLYSNYSTNTTLEEHTKTLEEHSQDHQEMKEGISENSQDIGETHTQVDSTLSSVDDLKEDFEQNQEETNDKLDYIIEKMKQQYNKEDKK